MTNLSGTDLLRLPGARHVCNPCARVSKRGKPALAELPERTILEAKRLVVRRVYLALHGQADGVRIASVERPAC